MMLHGFPEWSDMYMPLMRLLASHGYHSVACNQRGYSPRASPDDESAYDYNLLAQDTFDIADAVNLTLGGTTFHLIGHDHGAVLGWVAATSEDGARLIKSYTSLSIPHADAFSAGLFGPTADIEQQIASQYFTMFTLPNSSSIRGEFWFNTLGRTSGDANSGSFATAADFQKALWWYNGAMRAGYMAMPPLMSASSLLSHGSVSMASLRVLFGGDENPGFGQAHPIGNVSQPVLYVCGKQDSAILCDRPYALTTQQYCKANYTFLDVDCGHDLLNCTEKDTVMQAILAFLEQQHAA